MRELEASDLVYDWKKGHRYPWVALQDETLRDGLQGSYVTHPTIEQKQILLHLMDEIGINGADIGFPSSDDRQLNDVIELVRYKQRNGLRISLSCAGRTVDSDIYPIIQASEVAGAPIEADLFIGSSEVRKVTQDWVLEEMKSRVHQSVTLAVTHGLPVMFVTEDTTRAHPKSILELYETAIEAGAKRICISDTVGCADPDLTKTLIRFFRKKVIRGRDIQVDWHGHRDTDLATANSIAAAQEKVDRIHGAAGGVGERSGNTRMESLLISFNTRGSRADNLSFLTEYADYASGILKVQIPVNEPITGDAAFSTASGVHAAAILKALQKGRGDLAGIVYSAFDPKLIGRKLDVQIGMMSGEANVRLKLLLAGISDVNGEAVNSILQTAKGSSHPLSEREIQTIIHKVRRSKGRVEN